MMRDRRWEEREGQERRSHRPGALVAHWLGHTLWWSLLLSWHLVRLAICAALVLLEPAVRAVLVPVAFLGFWVTMIFGFLVGDPHFPRWGMLAFSLGALILYWLYVGLMSLFMSWPPHDHSR